MITAMIMTTPMVTAMPMPPGWTARPIPAPTAMIMGTAMATITAMPAIRMNTMPT